MRRNLATTARRLGIRWTSATAPETRPSGDPQAARTEVRGQWPSTFRPGSRPGRAHLFAVVSWGAAATTWLAKSLNTHPEIMCLHAANIPLLKFEPGFRLEGIQYAAFILRAADGYKVGGDVHGFPRWDIPVLKESFGEGFSSAVLVRDPIARLRSQLAFFKRPANRGEAHFVEPIRAYIGDVAAAAGVEVELADIDAILFLHAANMLNAVTDEQDIGPLYRTEDVTTQPQVFAELVEHLGGGRIEADGRWVDETLALHPVNTNPPAPLELSDWQRDALSKVVSPKAWELYEELGYRRVAL
jgi:hypothetical protein